MEQQVVGLQSQPNISKFDLYRLKKVLRDMPLQKVRELATEYQVEIPIEANDSSAAVGTLVKALNPTQQLELLKRYGDAGKRSTYLCFCKEKIPSPFKIQDKANSMIFIDDGSPIIENQPYFYQAKTDNDNDALKLRFYYFHDTIMIVDENNNEREVRPKHFGVAVYREDNHILEVRIKHKRMADKIATDTPIQLGLTSFLSINLMDEKLIQPFVDWALSLNSANIELYRTEEVAGSIHIAARKGMSLKNTTKLNKELQEGQLQGGHVTIEHEETKVNFRINFSDCHVSYTLFTVEPDITCVVKAIEKIMEGHQFDKQTELLKFFGK